MKSPLIPITIPSVYTNKAGERKPLPPRMAKCTPDTKAAILSLEESVSKLGGQLILSDMFRSYDMQYESYYNHSSGGKRAYSPPPGGSFHEAGRGFDIDLCALTIPLADFWKLAAKAGVNPIIKEPKTYIPEAWHFECRGSHQLVHDYYKRRGGFRSYQAYRTAAESAILSVGIMVNLFDRCLAEACIQSCLIRLGKNSGDIDGVIGSMTKAALKELGLKYDQSHANEVLIALEEMLKEKFVGEYGVVV